MRRKATAPHSTPHGWPSEVVETNMCPRGSGHQCDTGLCSRSWPDFSALHASQPSPAPALSSQLERGSSGGKTWRERSHSHQYSPQMCRISNSSDIGILCHPLSVKVSRMSCCRKDTKCTRYTGDYYGFMVMMTYDKCWKVSASFLNVNICIRRDYIIRRLARCQQLYDASSRGLFIPRTMLCLKMAAERRYSFCSGDRVSLGPIF